MLWLASTGTPSEEDKKKEKTEECSQEKDTCQEDEVKPDVRVSCTRIASNGDLITTRAGGLFTSPVRAAQKCQEKLDAMKL